MGVMPAGMWLRRAGTQLVLNAPATAITARQPPT